MDKQLCRRLTWILAGAPSSRRPVPSSSPITNKILTRPETISASQPLSGLFEGTSAPATAVFARHETFAPRFGWLKKGFDAAAENPEVFLGADAPVVLGVGKNMVRSIRYWCYAFKLLTDRSVPGQRGRASEPTPIGRALLGPKGWDPYLENPASLWLLHWLLLAEPCMATAWHFAFTIFSRPEFTADHMEEALAEFVAGSLGGPRVAASSLRKDVTCLLRMYGEPAPGVAVSEDTLHSPFADLGLLRPGVESRSYTFDVGEKPELPAKVVVAACLDYTGRSAPGAQTVSVSRLLYDPGSPGMALKLSESALCAAIEEVGTQHSAITLADTAGLVQLAFSGQPGPLAWTLLAEQLPLQREAAA